MVISGLWDVSFLLDDAPLITFEVERVDKWIVVFALLSSNEDHDIVNANALMVRDFAWACSSCFYRFPFHIPVGVVFQGLHSVQVNSPEIVECALF